MKRLEVLEVIENHKEWLYEVNEEIAMNGTNDILEIHKQDLIDVIEQLESQLFAIESKLTPIPEDWDDDYPDEYYEPHIFINDEIANEQARIMWSNMGDIAKKFDDNRLPF